MELEYFFSNPNYLSINCGSIETFKDSFISISYLELDSIIYCPYRTSFALIEGEMNRESFQKFLNTKKQSSTKIEWILPPNIYPKSREQFELLHSFGFRIQSVELSQYIDLVQDFSSNLYPEKRRKLRHGGRRDPIRGPTLSNFWCWSIVRTSLWVCLSRSVICPENTK